MKKAVFTLPKITIYKCHEMMYTHVEIEPLRKAMDMLVDYMKIYS
jgi:hypothetical protein